MSRKVLSMVMALASLAGVGIASTKHGEEPRKPRKKMTRGDLLLEEMQTLDAQEKVSARLKAEAEEKRRRKAEKMKKLVEKGVLRG